MEERTDIQQIKAVLLRKVLDRLDREKLPKRGDDAVRGGSSGGH